MNGTKNHTALDVWFWLWEIKHTNWHLLHCRITKLHRNNGAASIIPGQISIQRLVSCHQNIVQETVSRRKCTEASLKERSLEQGYHSYCSDTTIKRERHRNHCYCPLGVGMEV